MLCGYQNGTPQNRSNLAVLETLADAMFAMTTDSAGIIIPEAIRTFRFSLTAPGIAMGGIAIGALLLRQFVGRRRTIIVA